MAESKDPTSARLEEPETKKPKSIAAPTDSPEGETVATSGDENAPVVVSAGAGPKSAASEARPTVKSAKKPAKSKKEEPATSVAAPESLSLSADEIEKPKVIKAKGS